MDLEKMVGSVIGDKADDILDGVTHGKIGEIAQKFGISKEDLAKKAVEAFTKAGGSLTHGDAASKILAHAEDIAKSIGKK